MMPEHESQPTDFDWRLTTFEGARREQLRRWAQLPLEDLLKALEEMEDLSRQLGTAPAAECGEAVWNVSVSESPAEYGKGGADQECDDDKREGS